MNRSVARSLALALALLGAGCGEETASIPVPKEPGPGAMGYFCRMTLAEHQGPKGQILPKGWSEPLWFSSVRDALTYVGQDIISERELAAFWVNDMEQGSWEKPALGSWIDAQSAWYVIDSKKSSGMGGSEAVPFRRREAAQGFAAQFGGRVLGYAEARDAINTPPEIPDTEASGI